MALSTAVRLRSSGSPSADSAVKLRHVQVRLLGDGRHAAKGLGNLAQGNKKVGLVAFIKDIIEVLPCKSRILAKQFGHRFVCARSFILCPPLPVLPVLSVPNRTLYVGILRALVTTSEQE